MMLTNQDIEIMDNYNEMYGSHANKVPAHIIKHWTDAKDHHLFRLFGDKLIYEKEITYGACANDQEVELAKNEDYKAFKSDIVTKYCLQIGGMPQALLEHCDEAMSWSVNNLIHTLLAPTALVANRVSAFGVYTLNNKNFKVEQGAKTLRILRKLLVALDYDNMPLFEKVQTAVSIAIDRKVEKKGTLCVSIHPMDYFTMSDNEHDWDSCMSWRNDGGHREGTIACLGGQDCVVAYIKSTKDSEDYNWNSKKWRQLIAIKEDCIITNRHYPAYREDVQKEVVSMLRTIAKRNMGWEYETEHRERLGPDLLLTGVMYNDFYNSDAQAQIFNKLGCVNEPVQIALASNGCCMDCGNEMEEGTGDVVCYKCRGFQWCYYCESYECGEFYTDADGDSICECCIENHFLWCEECEEYHHKDNILYLEAEDMHVCSTCIENHYQQCDNCGEFHRANEWYEEGKTICKSCEKMLEEIAEGKNPSKEE